MASLSRHVARRFAQRFGRGQLISRRVHTGEVIAYFQRRGEHEIVLPPAGQ